MAVEDNRTKGERRRAEILQLARAQLIAGGYDAFAMREVAAAAGTKIGHIQYYFPTRHDLLEALIRDEFEANLAAVQTIIEQGHTARSTLESIVRELVGLWLSDGAQVYIVMPFLALHEDRFRKLSEEIYGRFNDMLADVLAAADPDVPAKTIRMKARMITAVMDGGLFQAGSSPGIADEIVETSMLIAGIRR